MYPSPTALASSILDDREAQHVQALAPGRTEAEPMQRHERADRRSRWVTPSALLLACAIGCQPPPAGTAPRVVPEPAAGRAAVATALSEWQRGREPGTIDTVRPAVVVVDSHRKPGQTLEQFEIVGQADDDNSRTFTVRARLANPAEEPLLRFHVFGREPLWVFRQEDYDMLTHWDCPPPANPAAGPAGATKEHLHAATEPAESREQDAGNAGPPEVARP
jgi:hypothetical protein